MHTPPPGDVCRSFLNKIKFDKDRAVSGIDCDNHVSVKQITSTSLTWATTFNSSIFRAKERTLAISTIGT